MSDDIYTQVHNTYMDAVTRLKSIRRSTARDDFHQYVLASAKDGSPSVSYSASTSELAEYIRKYAIGLGFDVAGEGRDVHVRWDRPPKETNNGNLG